MLRLARAVADDGCSFEELLVALADKLWKGERDEELEKNIIRLVAERLRRDVWDVLIELDSHFEMIASEGAERLARSRD